MGKTVMVEKSALTVVGLKGEHWEGAPAPRDVTQI